MNGFVNFHLIFQFEFQCMTNWWQHFNDLGFGYLSKGSRKLFIFIMTNRRFLSFRWKSNIFSSEFHVVAREQLKRCCKVNCCGNRILNNKSKFSHNSNTFLSDQPPAAKRLHYGKVVFKTGDRYFQLIFDCFPMASSISHFDLWVSRTDCSKFGRRKHSTNCCWWRSVNYVWMVV